MTLFVPMLIAVDTDDQAEAHECARVVAESTSGESFRLVTTDPDMPALRESAKHCADVLIDGYELVR